MRILITNAWLDLYGGSENWVLTMCQAFKKLGMDIEVLTNRWGAMWSNQIEPLGVKKATGGKYDLMLVNHGTHFPQVEKWQGKKVNIIHGLTPSAEKPIEWADYSVGISDEITEALKLDCTIWNPVNTDVFKEDVKDIDLLIMSRDPRAHEEIRDLCPSVEIVGHTKRDKPLTQKQLAEVMGRSRVVIGVGRAIYEAQYCDTAQLIYDRRHYENEQFAYWLSNVPLVDALHYNFTQRAKVPQQSLAECLDNAPLERQWRRIFDYIDIAEQYIAL